VALAATTAATLAVTVPMAFGDGQITAVPRDQFAPNSVTIDQGVRVSFHNSDLDTHNVTADKLSGDGKPIFATAGDVGGGASAPVAGTEYLSSGDYSFVCTIHPGMNGTLHVTAAGTPVPRPAGTTGPGPGPTSHPSGAGKPRPTATRKKRHCTKRHGKRRCTVAKRRHSRKRR